LEYDKTWDKFINDTTYENTHFKFSFSYPKGSIFANAHTQTGFIVRLFLPDRKTIMGDEENVGIYIRERVADLEEWIEEEKKIYQKNGPIEVLKVELGGQKAYRVIETTNYTSPKGTREMFYFTVRNNTLYSLNYFPVVEENIKTVEEIANSFKFTE
jgi:hypothetical protein